MSCSCNGNNVVEVKCPYSMWDLSVCENLQCTQLLHVDWGLAGKKRSPLYACTHFLCNFSAACRHTNTPISSTLHAFTRVAVVTKFELFSHRMRYINLHLTLTLTLTDSACRAHRAVIFAIAQLSCHWRCWILLLFLHWKAEQKLVVAGSTIGEGFDCRFKMYWIFNMQYPAHCTNVLKFLEHLSTRWRSHQKCPQPCRNYAVILLLTPIHSSCSSRLICLNWYTTAFFPSFRMLQNLVQLERDLKVTVAAVKLIDSYTQSLLCVIAPSRLTYLINKSYISAYEIYYNVALQPCN